MCMLVNKYVPLYFTVIMGVRDHCVMLKRTFYDHFFSLEHILIVKISVWRVLLLDWCWAYLFLIWLIMLLTPLASWRGIFGLAFFFGIMKNQNHLRWSTFGIIVIVIHLIVLTVLWRCYFLCYHCQFHPRTYAFSLFRFKK